MIYIVIGTWTIVLSQAIIICTFLSSFLSKMIDDLLQSNYAAESKSKYELLKKLWFFIRDLFVAFSILNLKLLYIKSVPILDIKHCLSSYRVLHLLSPEKEISQLKKQITKLLMPIYLQFNLDIIFFEQLLEPYNSVFHKIF